MIVFHGNSICKKISDLVINLSRLPVCDHDHDDTWQASQSQSTTTTKGPRSTTTTLQEKHSSMSGTDGCSEDMEGDNASPTTQALRETLVARTAGTAISGWRTEERRDGHLQHRGTRPIKVLTPMFDPSY